MVIVDLLIISSRQVIRNRGRYQAVLLAVALGLAGLTILLTMGDSIEKKIGQNLELLGKATIIKAGWDFDKKVRWHHGEFNDKDLNALRSLHGVIWVAPFVKRRDQIFATGNSSTKGQIVGVDHNFFPALLLSLSKGQEITEEDVSLRKPVCVMGRAIAQELFGGEATPVGRSFTSHGILCEVAGLLGGVEDHEFSHSIFIPISLAKAVFPDIDRTEGIYLRAQDWDSVHQTSKDIRQILKTNHQGYADALAIEYFPEKIKTIGQVRFWVKFLLYIGIFASVALGGLGIMNLMIVAVQERTTEIGLRKAVGASDRAILAQFLLEAVGISLVGIFLAFFLALIFTLLLWLLFAMTPSWSAFALATVVGGALGVSVGAMAGFAPARTASCFDPVTAIRFE
ncbi:MAG: ABC transporter permease [Pseudomonadota bacterium]